MNSKLTRENLGDVFRDPAGNEWQLIAYCDRPTVKMKELDTGEEIYFAVDSKIAGDFAWERNSHEPPHD